MIIIVYLIQVNEVMLHFHLFVLSYNTNLLVEVYQLAI